MTTTIYTFCWNEIFMLPHFFKHYAWADKIVVYDNESTDGSQEFIKSHPKGELRTYKTNNKLDNKAIMDLKNNCWKGDESDWVVVCDMDEFLIGQKKIEKYAGEVFSFNCKTWEMVSETIPTDFKEVKLKYRYPEWAYKGICFSPKLKEINFVPGCHRYKPIPYNILGNTLDYYHYASLSEDYMVERWQKYAARMSDNDLKMKWAPQYLWTEIDIRREYRRRLRLAQHSS